MTAPEFKATLKPLGEVGKVIIEELHEHNIYAMKVSWATPQMTVIRAIGPWATYKTDARAAFLESLRWLQAAERRV